MTFITGTVGPDSIIGTDGSDWIESLNGDDTIFAGAGDDTINPGLGSDSIDAGQGVDLLGYEGVVGGVIVNNSSNIRSGINPWTVSIESGQNKDSFESVEHFSLTSDSDELHSDVETRVYAGAGSDAIYIYGAEAEIAPGSGADTIFADHTQPSRLVYSPNEYQTESRIASNGIVVTYFDDGQEILAGQVVDNWGDTDTFVGIEDVEGTPQADAFQGAGDLELNFYGHAGQDTIKGGGGGDYLYGGADDDTMSGGAGDDYIEGGTGVNILSGGEGNDQFALDLLGYSIITDYQSGELIWLKIGGDGYVTSSLAEKITLEYNSLNDTTNLIYGDTDQASAIASLNGTWFLDQVWYSENAAISLKQEAPSMVRENQRLIEPDPIAASSQIVSYLFDGYSFEHDDDGSFLSGFEGRLAVYGSPDLELQFIYNKNLAGLQIFKTDGELYDVQVNGYTLFDDAGKALMYSELTDFELGNPDNTARAAFLETVTLDWSDDQNQFVPQGQTHIFNLSGVPLFVGQLDMSAVGELIGLVQEPNNGYSATTVTNLTWSAEITSGANVTNIPNFQNTLFSPYDEAQDGVLTQYEINGFSFIIDNEKAATLEANVTDEALTSAPFVQIPQAAKISLIGSPDLELSIEEFSGGNGEGVDLSGTVETLLRIAKGELYTVLIDGTPLEATPATAIRFFADKIVGADGLETSALVVEIEQEATAQTGVFYLSENKFFKDYIPAPEEIIGLMSAGSNPNQLAEIQTIPNGIYKVSGFDGVSTRSVEYVQIEGTTAADSIYGTALDDQIDASSGNDTVYADAGDDIIYGGAGDDILYGGAGNDTLDDGTGTDIIYGGDGTDTFRRDLSLDFDDYAFVPIIDLPLGRFYAEGFEDNFDSLESIENVVVLGEFDYKVVGDGFGNEITTHLGDDYISAGEGDDKIDAGAGNDVIIGGGGSDVFSFHGDFGNDVIVDFNASEDILEFYAADGTVVPIGELVERKDQHGNRVLSTADGLSSVTLAPVLPPSEPAFDIVLTSTAGDVARFEIYATEAANSGDPGLEDIQFVLSHGVNDMAIDETSIETTFALGVPVYDAATGELELAAIAFPAFTDFATPVLTFDATILNEQSPFSITMDEILVDDTSQAVVQEQVDFTSVDITTTLLDRFGNSLTDTDVSALVATPGDDVFLRLVSTSSDGSVFEIVASPSEAVSSVDFELVDPAGVRDFQIGEALSEWVVEANTTAADIVRFAGFGSVDGSQDLAAGQETVLATFTTSSDPNIAVEGIVLDQTAQRDIVFGEVAPLSQAGGVSVHKVMRGADVYLFADKQVDEASSDAITANDALQALRLAVGLTKQDGTAEWHDYLAADINRDGQVSANDALNILKSAVGLDDGVSADWVFVDGSGDWTDIGRKNTVYEEGVLLDNVTSDGPVDMTGILVGDVNGSYVV